MVYASTSEFPSHARVQLGVWVDLRELEIYPLMPPHEICHGRLCLLDPKPDRDTGNLSRSRFLFRVRALTFPPSFFWVRLLNRVLPGN